jgi:nucleoside-diphosphate-sugar epimerase
MKKALVLGGGGFIGNAMVERLIGEGFWVRAVDLKGPDFSKSNANEFILGDLRDVQIVRESLEITDDFDEIYQFAADMGGAGFVFTGENDAEIMHNSAKINLNVLEGIHMRNQTIKRNKTKIFYSSSACMYPEHNQMDPLNPNCTEDSAYPANPDSEYGWEKLFSERLFLAYNRNHGIPIAIARYHNIYGPLGTWEGGREKAPAALCRKIAKVAGNEGEIEIWGDGEQTRSFLYIDECIEATRRLMASNFQGPVNIGSEEMVTINQLVRVIAKISNKKIKTVHVLDAPTGVRGRNSDNRLIREKLGWDFSMTLEDGLKKTYSWINNQIQKTSLKI